MGEMERWEAGVEHLTPFTFHVSRFTFRVSRLIYGVLLLALLTTWGEFALRVVWPALTGPTWPAPAAWVAARLIWEGHPELIYTDRATLWQIDARLGVPRDIFEANAPTTILPYLPLGNLAVPVARNIWLVAGLAGFLAGWIILLRVLRLPPGAALALSALVPLFPALRDNIVKAQAYPPVFLLAVAGAVWAVQARDPSQPGGNPSRWAAGWAGLAFGLLAMLRFYYGGVLLLPALVWRQGRVLLAAAVVFGVAAPVTLLWWGPGLWVAALGFAVSWRDRPETAVTAYQTINSVLTHLLRYDATWNRGPIANLPGLVGPLWWALALALLGVSAATLWRGGAQPGGMLRRLLLYTLAIPLALVLAPAAEEYHYLLILFPLVVTGVALWQDSRQVGFTRIPGRAPLPGAGERRYLLAAWSVFVAVLVLLGGRWNYNVVEVGGWHALLHYPRLYGALLLWGLMLVLAWHCPQRHEGQSR